MARLSLLVAALLAGLANARLPDGRPHANMFKPPGIPVIPVPAGTAVQNSSGTFDQLIDHNDPSKGTFKQRFWHSYEYYKEGGPVIIMTPGEANAEPYTGYLTNRSITGGIAQQEGGTVVIVEHRFYGLSNPFPDLSVQSFNVSTIQQAIDDLDYFARNVNLPMPNGDQIGPDQAPWVLVGGSYSGALTAWTMVNKPDLMWAGYSSSGVVETIYDFWQYFEPVRLNMPKNCSADVNKVVEHVDEVFSGNDTDAIQALKENWGMGNVSHLDDVAGALRNNLWDWQSLQPTTGAGNTFTRFCDALEVKDGEVAPEEGFGLDNAVTAWGDFWTEGGYLDNLCGDNDVETCLGTYDKNATFYTNTTIDNSWRSWNWFVCNYVGWYQDAAPSDIPTLVSRLVQPDYEIRQCQFMFPEAFSEPPVADTNGTNAEYHGWDIKEERLFFANGQRDPWRYATVSAPDSPAVNSSSQPIGVSDGFHCSDLSMITGSVDGTVGAVQTTALSFMHEWIAEFQPSNSSSSSSSSKRATTSHFDKILPRDEPLLKKVASPISLKPVNAWVKSFGSF